MLPNVPELNISKCTKFIFSVFSTLHSTLFFPLFTLFPWKILRTNILFFINYHSLTCLYLSTALLSISLSGSLLLVTSISRINLHLFLFSKLCFWSASPLYYSALKPIPRCTIQEGKVRGFENSHSNCYRLVLEPENSRKGLHYQRLGNQIKNQRCYLRSRSSSSPALFSVF